MSVLVGIGRREHRDPPAVVPPRQSHPQLAHERDITRRGTLLGLA
ncbi:hypothetical protein ACWFRQ_26185 [Streptomyces niveus]